MKKIIHFLSYIPGLTVGVSSLMLLTYTPYSMIWVLLAIFNALGCLYLLDNSHNIAKSLTDVWHILTGKTLRR